MQGTNSLNDFFKYIWFKHIAVILRGISQIFLQNKVLSGILILIGVVYSSFIIGSAMLVALVFALILVNIFCFDKNIINQGIYGFNAALVGAATFIFLKPILLSWILMLLGVALSVIVQHFFIKNKLQLFTFPFVIVVWIILLVSNLLNLSVNVSISNLPSDISSNHHIVYALKSFGQVIFQSNAVVGFVFFIAIFIKKPIAALIALISTIMFNQIAVYLEYPIQDIQLGLYGYNVVLSAIVFAGYRLLDIIYTVLACLMTFVVSLIMFKLNIIQLTFPFIISCFVFSEIKNRQQRIVS